MNTKGVNNNGAINFSGSRLNDFHWIEDYQQKIGKEKLYEFINIVYGWLMRMKRGDCVDLLANKSITDQNRDLFIKIACLFISEGHSDYEFSNNYTVIIHKENQPVIWNKKKKEK